ncbi:MAG: hypothetical protein V2J24_08295 [Pseudomonadales bacterium]|nr:hypothetical protein [Pseudomonadales bacterium]
MAPEETDPSGAFDDLVVEPLPEAPGLQVRGRGPMTPAWARASMAAVLASPRFEAGVNVLLDLSAMDFTGVVARDMGIISRQERSILDGDALPGRVAVLVEEDLPYGLSRMFEALSERADGPIYRVVRSRADALAWFAQG